MNKFMNKAEDYDKEVAQGFIKAYGEKLIFPNGDLSCVVLKEKPLNSQVVCVGICDGGHMPAFAGYVASGILFACSVGKTFHSPRAIDIFQTVRLAEMGKGVILIPLIWNEELNKEVQIAVELLKKEGIDVSATEIRDDCMQPKNDSSKRLTGAGIFFACSIASKAASEGKSKEEIMQLLKKVNDNMRTAANVGGSFYLPTTNEPFMNIEKGKMQVGVGLHGEQGFEMIDFPPAYMSAEHLFRHRINKELNIQPKEDIALLINDLGSTTIDELLIIYQEETRQFELNGANIVRSFIGRYVTTLDMDGISITALKLDEQMKKYIIETDDILTH